MNAAKSIDTMIAEFMLDDVSSDSAADIVNGGENGDANGENDCNETIEPLLDPKNERLTILPISPDFKDIWDLYEEQMNSFWRASEIDFSRDYDDFMTLDEGEQNLIKMILAFFASSDGIVNFNLRERFLKEIKVTEAQVAYAFQMMMENIHGEVYSKMLEAIIKDEDERKKLFDAINTVEVIKIMADWALKWIHSTDSFPHRLIAFACVEGIFFSSSFASIFWLKKYRNQGKNIMNGLVKSNQLISRDEGCHCKFACTLYSKIVNKLNMNTVHEMIHEAVNISKSFAKNAIQCDMIGMNLELMNQYLEYVGDTLLVMLGYEKKYNTINPFTFMESIGMMNKTNFFESRPTEYQSAVNNKNFIRDKIRILDDF